jgi:hypothetical protein
MCSGASHPDIPPSRDEGGLERYGIYRCACSDVRDMPFPLEPRSTNGRAVSRFVRHARFDRRCCCVTPMPPPAPIRQARGFLECRAFDRWDAFYITRIYTREPITI